MLRIFAINCVRVKVLTWGFKVVGRLAGEKAPVSSVVMCRYLVSLTSLPLTDQFTTVASTHSGVGFGAFKMGRFRVDGTVD